MTTRVLIVEDDESLARVLKGNLVYEGFAVHCVANGSEATQSALETKPDLILLDVTLPGRDGFDVCRELNAHRLRTPIIMLTARTQIEYKVRGLESGADDYVTKPFVFAELLARMRAVLRRSQQGVDTLRLGDVVIDFGQMQAVRGPHAVALTSREFAFLQYLAERAGRAVSREELLLSVWGYHHVPLTRTVDNFVARLRRKIEDDPQHPRFVRTVHGGGYRLTPTGSSD